MAKAPKRRVFHSSLTKAGWEVRENKKTLSKHATQLDCEAAAIKMALTPSCTWVASWPNWTGWNRKYAHAPPMRLPALPRCTPPQSRVALN